MKRAGRAAVGTLLIAVGVAGVAFGVTSRSSATTASPYLSAQVSTGTVQKTISDSGSVVDQYTYAIAPKTDPVLTAQDGVTAGQGHSASGYTATSVKVGAGDTVKKDDVLAQVKDGSDKKSDVKAPYDGRIRSVGTHVDAAAGSIATLGVGRQDVVINVSEYDITRLKVHQNASLQLDGNGDTFDGTVASIGQSAKASSGVQNYQVVLHTSDLPSAARLGMTVTATITTTSKSGVLTVPLTAVSGTAGDATVQVIDGQGTAQQKVHTQSVSVGLVGDSTVQITKGIQAGQQVVTGMPGAAAASASTSTAPRGRFGGN